VTPAFDRPVRGTGYSWWYLDALSDDGRHGITLIAFLGSVFSPYYARARRRQGEAVDPMAHCAINVALYAAGGQSVPTGWAMTERNAPCVRRSAMRLQIGPSVLQWEGDTLCVSLDEITSPWPARIRGEVRLRADQRLGACYPLDPGGHHHWCPIAPCARVDVALEHPAMRWSGTGYMDANHGERPLEQDFARWDWSRAALARGGSAVLYDVTGADGARRALALRFDGRGRAKPFEPPAPVSLPSTRWHVLRGTRADPGAPPRVVRMLEDGPFYARSVLATRLCGEAVTAVHESLSLQRFSAPWVQLLLPFRMRRRVR
jgi:carotenoid 1,2-hydratase